MGIPATEFKAVMRTITTSTDFTPPSTLTASTFLNSHCQLEGDLVQHHHGIPQEQNANSPVTAFPRSELHEPRNESVESSQPKALSRTNSRSTSPPRRTFQDLFPNLGPISAAENAFVQELGRQHMLEPGRSSTSADWVLQETQALCERLMNCEAYCKYRDRQPKFGDPAQKWSDRMEVAFWRAAVFFPPVGRKQQRLGDNKPKGRNEIVSTLIERWTGDKRCRKQVSSHIQVIKKMVKHDPLILKYLHVPLTKSTRNARRDGRAQSGLQYTLRQSRGRYSRHQPRPLKFPTSATRNHYDHNILEQMAMHAPLRFEMFIQNTDSASNLIVHEITQSRGAEDLRCSDPLTGTVSASRAQEQDLHIDSAKILQEFHPTLFLIWQRGALDGGQVIMAEASLSLCVLRNFTGHKLGIFHEFGSDSNFDASRYDAFYCRTTFYQDQRKIEDAPARIISGRKKLDTQEILKHNMLGNVPFASEFWAAKVIELSSQLRKAADARETGEKLSRENSGRAEGFARSARVIEQGVRESLRRLSAVQEITATSDHETSGRRETRILTVLWNFRQAEVGRKGEMTWRNVTLPGQSVVSSHHLSPLREQRIGPDARYRARSKKEQNTTENGLNIYGDIFDSTGPYEYRPPRPLDLDLLQGLPSVPGLHGLQLPTPISATDDNYSSFYSPNNVDFTSGHIELCMVGASQPSIGFEGLGEIPMLDSQFDGETSHPPSQLRVFEPFEPSHQIMQQQRWAERPQFPGGPYFHQVPFAASPTDHHNEPHGSQSAFQMLTANSNQSAPNSAHPDFASQTGGYDFVPAEEQHTEGGAEDAVLG